MQKSKKKINISDKGKRGEYIVRDLIRSFGWEGQRMPGSGAFEHMKGDEIFPGLPFFFEVKNTKNTTFIPWFKKARDQAGTKSPMIAWINRGEVYAFLLLGDLLTIMKTGTFYAPKIKKPEKHPRLTLEETSGLQFNKKTQIKKKGQ
jgi:hypothetical protein